jgi:molybdate transport system regulatory protein
MANRDGSARVQFRLRITKGEDIAVGPGKIDLLEAIAATGSISAAAKRLAMSYRRAWLLVDTMNRCFKGPVVEAEAGGQRGGGAALTLLGTEVVRRYRHAEALAARAADAELAALERLLRGAPE